MAYKQKGWSAFTAKDDDKKKIKNTISPEHAKGINVENISAVQNKGGQNFVVEVGDNEYYDPTAKDNIGGYTGKWEGNYNDINNKRDTMLVNPSYKVGDLIDETEWETGKATKNPQDFWKGKKKKSPMKKGKDDYWKKQLDDKTGEYYPQSRRGMKRLYPSEPYALGKDNWKNIGGGYRENFRMYEPISKVISDSDKPQTVKDREISSYIGPRKATMSGKWPQTWKREEYEPQTKKKKKK